MNLYEMFDNSRKLTLIDALEDFLPMAMSHLNISVLPKITFQKDVYSAEHPTFGRFTNDSKVVFVDIENRHPNDILRTLAHELTHFAQNERGELDQHSGDTGSDAENEANATAGVIMRNFNKKFPEYLKLEPVVLSQQVNEKWSNKYKRSIDCNNPKGFSQRAHCQGRKKANEDTCETHKSPSGRMTNMCPDDDDYAINYGKQNEAVEPHEPGYQHDILTMPQNTLVIDTPGELDWYKIGQHFPTLGKEDPHEYGQSESDMVVSFANAEEMSKFAQIAAKLGLKIKSIGGTQEHPEIHSEPKMENFADGKKPGRKGLAKRVGVDCSQSISKLRSIAKSSSGERQRMAHWCANMKSGRNK